MATSPWNSRNAITGPEVKQAIELGKLTEISFVESNEGWYVVVNLSWREEDLYLATLQNKDKPKYFTDLHRLARSMKNNYPTVRHGKWYFMEP